MSKLLSVIMPIYNNSEFLESSVKSILDQTYKNFEFIILDDGSTEDIERIVSGFNDNRIRFYRNRENIGLTKSLNICLDLAKGDVIARQDGDDLSIINRFEEQIKLFKGEKIGLISSWAKSMNHYGVVEDHDWFDITIRTDEKFIKNNIHKANYIVGPLSMYTREVFEKVGYYEEELITAQDYEMWIRILKYFDLKIFKKTLGYIRRNNNSVRRKYTYNIQELIKRCNKLADKRHSIKTRSKFEWEDSFE